MHDDHHIIQQADGDKALFTIVKAVVFKGKCGPSKTLCAKEKSKPCLKMLDFCLSSCQVNFTFSIDV